jgi:hypothetical protein
MKSGALFITLLGPPILLALVALGACRLPWSAAFTAMLGAAILSPALCDWLKGRFDPLCVKAVATYAMVFFFLAPAADLTFLIGPEVANYLDRTQLEYGFLSPSADGRLALTLAVIIVGVVGFWLGFRMSPNPRTVRMKARRRLKAGVLAGYWWFGLVLVGVGLSVIILEVQLVGGWQLWMSRTWHNRREAEYDELFNYLSMTKLLLAPGCLILLETAIRRKSAVTWFLGVGVTAAANVILVLDGARRVPLGILFGLAAVRHYGRSRLRPCTVILCGLIGLATAAFLLPIRTSIQETALLEVPASAMRTLSSLPTGKLVREGTEMTGGFDSLLALVRTVPSEVEPLWGATYLKLLVFPIPRSIWPGKPSGFGETFAAVFYPSYKGLSVGATIVGEAFFNFLWPGVFVTMFLLGLMLRHLEHYCQWYPYVEMQPVLRAMLALMTLELFRGPLFVLMFYGFQFMTVATAARVVNRSGWRGTSERCFAYARRTCGRLLLSRAGL